MSFVGGLSTPIPADASVGLDGFTIEPHIPWLDTPESSAPHLTATPSRDAVSDKVGATLAQFLVDEGGNATYSVPIQVPPGTAGMTPKLALSYNSRGPNGVMGPGWSIEGASQITRCRQARENGDFMSGTTPVDGNPAPINFTQSDRFCLDGVRLLVTSGTYGANNSVYSPENDPTTQVTATVTTTAAGPDTFTVRRKDGTTSTYGKTSSSSNARITATLPATGATVAVSWVIARVQDAAGNYIDYSYNIGPGSSTFPFPAVEFTLAQVSYTGHATGTTSSPYASVSFTYTTLGAAKVRLGYQAGIAFLQSQQLQSVTVADSTLSVPTIRFYALTYQTSTSGSGWPQVSKITECRDGTQTVCFAPTTFTWSAATRAFDDSPGSQNGPSFSNLVGYKIGDVDGDGRQDLVYAVNNDSQCSGVSAIYVAYFDKTASNQMTLVKPSQHPVCAPVNLNGADRDWYLIDYNGDGRADLMIGGAGGSNWIVRPGIAGRPASIGTSAFDTGSNLLAGLSTPIAVPSYLAVGVGLLADVNGDGLPDFIYPVASSTTYPFGVAVRIMTRQSGGSFAFANPTSISLTMNSSPCPTGGSSQCLFDIVTSGTSYLGDNHQSGAITTDVNGDGRADLTILVYVLSSTDQADFGSEPGIPVYYPSDDLRLATTSTNYYYQFTANGVDGTNTLNFKEYWHQLAYNGTWSLPSNSANFYTVDLNGDGLADILYQDPSSSTTYKVMVNKGDGYQAAISVSGITSSGVSPPIQLADITGDGKTDIVYFPTSTTANYVSLVPTTVAASPWAFSAATSVPGGGIKASSGQAALLGDFDGDGAPDFLAFSASASSNNLYASRSLGAPSTSCKAATNSSTCSRYHARDVIVSFTNGYGATTTVAYQPLTNSGVYQQTVANSRALNNDTYGYGSPVFDVLAPLYVVSEAHSSAPTQGKPNATSNVYYQYEGALMQGGGRGFLGFWETWAFDDNDSAAEGNKYMVTLNGYGQDYPFIGVPETMFKLAFAGALTRGSATLDSCALNGPEATAGCFNGSRWPDLLNSTGVTVRFSGAQPVCQGAGCTALPSNLAAQCTSAATQSDLDDAGNPITNSLFTPPAIPGPIFVYAWRSSDTQYELTSPGSKTAGTQTTSCYDGSAPPSYSNLLNSRIVTSDGNGIVAQKLMANSYSDTTANWRLGRLSESQVTFKRPGQSDITRKSNFTYAPATGILDSEHIQSGGAADQDLRTLYTLDGWGNRTGAYQCSSDLSDNACTGTSFAQQLAYGTGVHRYAKTTWDTRGRYTTESKLPFYTSSGSTHLSEQTALTVTRDEFGNPATQSSKNGLTQTALFGAMGRPYFTSDNTGKASTTTYRMCGSGTSQVPCTGDAMLKFRAQTVMAGAPTIWTYYDVLGRAVLTITQAYDDNDSDKAFTAVCSYRDAHDRPTYQSEPFFLNVAANADGSPKLLTSGASPCASAAYATTTQYDVLGRVVLVTHPDASTVIRGYTGLETLTTDARSVVWREVKNALGEVILTQDPEDSGDPAVGALVDTTYDAAGDVLSISRDAQHNGTVNSTTKVVTTFTYDALGRTQTKTDPDSGKTTFSYNAAGDLIQQIDAKNQKIQQSFDALGRRWKRVADGADGKTITDTWTYDISDHGYGQFASESRQATGGTSFTRTFGYDGYGRSNGRTTSIDSDAYSETTTYDEYGRPKAQQDASGASLSTTYSTHGYISKLTDSRAGTIYLIDKMTARDQVEKDRRAGSASLASTITYQANTGRVSTICSGAQSGTGRCNLQDLAYTFDDGGNLLSRTRANSSAPTKEEFENDAVSRLTSAKLTKIGGVTQSPAVATNTISYDLLGNICSKNGIAYAYFGRAGCAGSGTSGSPHAVSKTTLGGASTTYGYDSNGNQTTRSGTPARVLSYNALNQPSLATLGTSTTTVFEYGPDGDRFRHADVAPVQWPAGCRAATDRIFCNGFEGTQTGGTATMLYVGNVEITISGSTKTYRRYLAGVAIDTVRSGIGSTAYVYTDQLGSLDAIVSSTGALIAQMSFDVHGNRRDPIVWQGAGAVTNATPRGFTAHEHVDAFAFIHMNGRLYDPVLGRMLQADPMTGPGAQGLNGFSYVVNNPLALTDPTGYSWWHNLDRIAGWITFGPGFPTIRSDYYAFLGNPYVRLVGAIIAGYFTFGAVYGAFSTEFLAGTGGTIVAGASAGAASGFVSSAIQTRSFQMAWRGAAAGAVAGGIAGYYGNTQSLQRVGVETVAGGVESRIQGGDFIDGVKFAFIVSSLSYANYRMRKHEWERASRRYYNVDGDGNGMYGIGGKLAGSRRETDPDVEYMLGLKCDATAGGCQGAPVNPGDVRARLGSVGYESDSMLNSIAESFAGPHDWLRDMTGSYDQWGNSNHFEGLSATLDSVRNYVEIPMAAPFAVGGLIHETPGVYLPLQCMTVGECN